MESRGKKSFQLKLESEIVQFAWLIPWLVAVFVFKPSASGGGYRSVLHQVSDCGSAVRTTNQSSHSSSGLGTPVFYRTGVALEHWSVPLSAHSTRLCNWHFTLWSGNLLHKFDCLQLSGAKSRTEMKKKYADKVLQMSTHFIHNLT